MKKGLSDIVTTVLIILLVVAAVVVIWGFIRPTLDQAGKSIQKGSTCISNYIEPVTCKINGDGSASKPYNLTVGVRRMTDDALVGSVANVHVSTEFTSGSLETNTTALSAPASSGAVSSGVVGFSQAFAFSTSQAPRRIVVSADLRLKDGTVQSCSSTPKECTGGPVIVTPSAPPVTSISAVLQFTTSASTPLTGSSPPGSPAFTVSNGATCSATQIVGGRLQTSCTFPQAGSYSLTTSATFTAQPGSISYAAQTVSFTVTSAGGTINIPFV